MIRSRVCCFDSSIMRAHCERLTHEAKKKERPSTPMFVGSRRERVDHIPPELLVHRQNKDASMLLINTATGPLLTRWASVRSLTHEVQGAALGWQVEQGLPIRPSLPIDVDLPP